MRQAKTWGWLVVIPALTTGCAPGDEPKLGQTDLPIFNTGAIHLSSEGILDFGATVFAANPTTLLEPLDFHRYEFQGHAGGTVTITAKASTCGDPDLVLDLFTADNLDAGGSQLIENDNSTLPCSLDSQISNFRLPVDGVYELIVRSFRQAGTSSGHGHYQLTMTCTNNACALAGAPNAATVRLNQATIDSGGINAAAIFDVGDFTFEHIFTVAEGLGNALAGAPGGGNPRPNFRNIPNNVEFAGFGGPVAQSCVTCHNVGGDDGAGDFNHNIIQNSDGINRASGLARNPPTVLGNGFRQRVGEEMTIDLKAELAAAQAIAKSTNMAVTRALSSKGISFGSLVANVDGTVNFASVVGVDTDLIVKPFGWKGREATLKRFVEAEFRTHFGIQSQPQVDGKCPSFMLGTAPCPDPDGDGVVNELTEGGLSAMAVYMGLREIPVRAPAITAVAQTRANSGESLFKSIGCATCHTQFMTLNSPIHVEAADSVANHGTGGKGITLNLAVDNKDPKPAVNANGSMTIEVFSDFKRHDVGAALADNQPFNQIAANQFITPPLWGVADSAPYLHDGRAPTLNDAILQHAGDAQAVRNAYASLTVDQQSEIQEFLGTLGRQEDVDAAAVKVNLGGFVLEQNSSLIDFTIPWGT